MSRCSTKTECKGAKRESGRRQQFKSLTNQELVNRGVWDLNCLEVNARRMLQAAIVFLTKTVGKNVLMTVGASEGWALSDAQVEYANVIFFWQWIFKLPLNTFKKEVLFSFFLL